MRTSSALMMVVLLCHHVPAQLPPPVDPALRARFGFVGPVIRKVGWGTGLLRVAVLDDKGPAVAVVNNGRRARLELLRIDGDELTQETESTEGEIQGLAVADVDGDGTPDFMLLTGRGRLITKLRGEGAKRVPAIDVGIAAVYDALRAGDIDGDGRADALVLTKDGLRWITALASKPRVSPADPVLSQAVRSLYLHDADADGHLDVVLGITDESMGLRIRRGRGDGSFGPWIALDVRQMRSVFPGTGVGGRPTLATVEGRHGRVVEYALRRRDDPTRRSIELTTLPEMRRNVRAFVHGDVDGDGDLDLVLADPDRARLLFLLEDKGAFTVRTAPSLSGIDSLSLTDLDGDGTLDLLLCSAEERALAWKSGAAPLDAFPVRLPAVEQPMAAAHHDGAVLFLARTDRRKAALYRLTRGEDGAFGAPEKLVDLGRLADSPLRMMMADLDQRAGPEVIYVQPGIGLRVLFAKDSGGYEAPAEGASGTAVAKIADGAVSLVEHGALPAVLAVRPRFARTLRFDAGGEPVVLAQDNGPEGIGEISLGIELRAGARAYLDNQAGKVWISEPRRAALSIDVPKLGATHLIEHAGAIVLLAKAAVVRIPFGAGSWELEKLRVHEPPTDKTQYYAGLAVDLDGDGHRELAVADNEMHGFHVLVADGDKLRRALSFPVYEQQEAAAGNYEPRVFEAGDMNGDGRDDLALICHDRVLIYLQEK